MSNKWSEERVSELVNKVDPQVQDGVVPYSVIASVATEMEVDPRGVGAKLRGMGYATQKKSDINTKSFSEEDKEEIVTFLEENPGQYTYAEIAAAVLGGEKTTSQIRGKILSLKMTDKVKPSDKKVYQSSFTDDQQEQLIDLVNQGLYIEEISEKLGLTQNQIRGKCLSLRNKEYISAIPPKRDKAAPTSKKGGMFAGLEEELSSLTLEELAERVGKVQQVVKSSLTRAGLSCADYPKEK